jgi:transcriptional regulator with XRE-family HTH domain
MEGLGARLKALREAKGWTQEELARRAGISVASVRHLEQADRVDPRTSSVVSLADAFGMAPERLLKALLQQEQG